MLFKNFHYFIHRFCIPLCILFFTFASLLNAFRSLFWFCHIWIKKFIDWLFSSFNFTLYPFYLNNKQTKKNGYNYIFVIYWLFVYLYISLFFLIFFHFILIGACILYIKRERWWTNSAYTGADYIWDPHNGISKIVRSILLQAFKIGD